MSVLGEVIIRPVRSSDITQITNLVHFGDKVHQHLDWCPAVDWIGHSPFFVAEWEYKLLAALACPPDPDGISWIRLFAVGSEISFKDAWSVMWKSTESQLLQSRTKVAAIAIQTWFQDLLAESNFSMVNAVTILEWKSGDVLPRMDNLHVKIRKMRVDDLDKVFQIDHAAFDPLWQNSIALLETAFSKASICTVAELEEEVVGFQLSSADRTKGHLARLAVHPYFQGQGIGCSLVTDVLNKFHLWGTTRVTVNTQTDNIASLSLYRKLGFYSLNETYPVYQKDLSD